MITPRRIIPLTFAFLLASCAVEVGGPTRELAYYDASGRVVYVEETPPPPRADVVLGPAPSPAHVWIGGYWAHRGTAWTWVPGHWMPRPRPGVVWVPGHWDRRPRGYVWVGGHWR